jgi:hypothetical protein
MPGCSSGGVEKSYMSDDKRCVICGASTVMIWTLDNMERAVVTYLCAVHAAPLVAVMDAAGDLPPSKQKPLADRPQKQPVHTRGRRRTALEPLVEWTPPSEPPLLNK